MLLVQEQGSINKSLNFDVALIQLSFHTNLINVFTNTSYVKVFQPKSYNISSQSNCAKGILVLFIYQNIFSIYYI